MSTDTDTDTTPAPGDPVTLMDWRSVPHAYEAWGGGSRWRTCRRCGRGANAQVHRQA